MSTLTRFITGSLIVLAACASLLVIQPVPSAQAANLIEYFKPVKGNLAVGQSVEYNFNGKTGDKLTITMALTDGGLDPFLSLYDSQGRLIGEDDNGGGKSDALLQGIVLPQDGQY